MNPWSRRVSGTLTWALLIAIGCSGGSGGGCGGCLAPIPGGFPPDQRGRNAITTKLSADGLRMLEDQLADLLVGQAGPLEFGVPCTKESIDVVFSKLDIFICDVDGNRTCNAADEDPSNRPDVPGHGRTCQAEMRIDRVKLNPKQNTDGSVEIGVVVNLRVNTGIIPIRASNLNCDIEYDSDDNPPAFLPLIVRLRLRVDVNHHDQLVFDVPNVDDLADAVDMNDLTFDGSGSLGWLCDAANLGFVKDMMFDRVQGSILLQVRDAIDQMRCQPCGENDSCAVGSCSNGVCYTRYEPNEDPARDLRQCPPALLGMEGRANLGETLGAFGPRNAQLDVSIVAGGKNADGSPSTRVQTDGIVLGVMGGTGVPKRAACVGTQRFQPRPIPTAMDFDAEAATPPPDGRSVAGYHLGLSFGDAFLDKAAFDAWAAGVLCLEIDNATAAVISSGLFQTFIPSLAQLTQGQDVPMLIALRPFNPPEVIIGRGTVKETPNGPVPDDALLTIEMKDLHVDFYALLENRQARLFTLVTDLKLPLSLEFDAQAGTVTPVLGSLSTLLTNARGENNELLAEDAQDLAAVLDGLIGFIEPALGGALSPIELPAMEGLKLDVMGARGAVKLPSGPGYEHLALFTKLEVVPAAPYSFRFDTDASLVSLEVPSTSAEVLAGGRPKAIVRATASGAMPNVFNGFEYSWRVDGGLWRPWTTSDHLEIAGPELVLQGRHAIDVRARERGLAESSDLTPARVWAVVDYEPPTVRLELDRETRTVRTLAKDTVSPPEGLRFRYRIGEAWSAFGPAREVPLSELGDEPVLEVEVTDESGRSATARFGDVASVVGLTAALPEESGGCATGAGTALALLALVALRRRRC